MMEEKELKDLLQWEVPQPTIWGGNVSNPKIWIVRGAATPFKIIMNRRWLEEHAPEIAKLAPRLSIEEKAARKIEKTSIIGVALAIDRDNKVFRFVLQPSKDIPQWAARLNVDKSGTLTISDKTLGSDLWTMFGMPMDGYKQFLETKVEREVKGKKVYVASYNSKAPENLMKLAAPTSRYKKKP